MAIAVMYSLNIIHSLKLCVCCYRRVYVACLPSTKKLFCVKWRLAKKNTVGFFFFSQMLGWNNKMLLFGFVHKYTNHCWTHKMLSPFRNELWLWCESNENWIYSFFSVRFALDVRDGDGSGTIWIIINTMWHLFVW